MAAKYASGKHAKGRCGRCGFKVEYRDMVDDGQYPGLRVCEDCRDMKHPVERAFDAQDGIALRKPAPDIDDDTGVGLNDANVTLVSTLDGNSFGGQT